MEIQITEHNNDVFRLKRKLGYDPSYETLAQSVQVSTPELILMLAVGEVARNMMLVSHLRLVVSVARQYQNLGLDTADLIQVCMYFWNTLQKSVIFH